MADIDAIQPPKDLSKTADFALRMAQQEARTGRAPGDPIGYGELPQHEISEKTARAKAIETTVRTFLQTRPEYKKNPRTFRFRMGDSVVYVDMDATALTLQSRKFRSEDVKAQFFHHMERPELDSLHSSQLPFPIADDDPSVEYMRIETVHPDNNDVQVIPAYYSSTVNTEIKEDEKKIFHFPQRGTDAAFAGIEDFAKRLQAGNLEKRTA